MDGRKGPCIVLDEVHMGVAWNIQVNNTFFATIVNWKVI